MTTGEQLEKIISDCVVKYETKHRNPDIKDVYNMMALLRVEADSNPEFKKDFQNFIKSMCVKS